MAEITLPRDPFIENFGHKFVNFGSCFAQNIKRILDRFGLESFFVAEICAHYNTEGLLRVLEIVASGRALTDDDLLCVDDQVFPFRNFFKVPFRGAGATRSILERLDVLYETLRSAIREADSFVITLGTSRIVRLKSNGQPLTAAAGLSADYWDLDLVDDVQNTENLRRICAALTTIRDGRPANLILTVSPQRYLFGHLFQPGAASHEGVALVDNFLSKCSLRIAAQKLADAPPPGFTVRYFPAFEVVYEELRMFESIAHYDYCHISQENTPVSVVKKFLLAYASDAVLDQLGAHTAIRGLWSEINKLRRGGLPASDRGVLKLVGRLETALDALGDDAAAPMVGMRVKLLDEYNRPLPKPVPAFTYHGQGNLVSWARILAAKEQVAEARATLGGVIELLRNRRTEDPESGEGIEHFIYEDALKLWKELFGGDPAQLERL